MPIQVRIPSTESFDGRSGSSRPQAEFSIAAHRKHRPAIPRREGSHLRSRWQGQGAFVNIFVNEEDIRVFGEPADADLRESMKYPSSPAIAGG